MSKEQKPDQTPSPTGGNIAIPHSRRGVKGYFKEVQREVKKVDWPTPHETTRLTGIVLAVCGMIVLILFSLSTIIDFLIGLLLHKGGSV